MLTGLHHVTLSIFHDQVRSQLSDINGECAEHNDN